MKTNFSARAVNMATYTDIYKDHSYRQFEKSAAYEPVRSWAWRNKK